MQRRQVRAVDSARRLQPQGNLRWPCSQALEGSRCAGFWRSSFASVNGDTVFVSTALARQLIGLKQETELVWRVRYFDLDLDTVEVLPINDAFCSDSVIRTVNAIQAKSRLRDLTTVST
jgi:hypothetical protein